MCTFVPVKPWEREMDDAPDAQVIVEFQWLVHNKWESPTDDIKIMRAAVKNRKRFARGLEEAGFKNPTPPIRDKAFEELCANYRSER